MVTKTGPSPRGSWTERWSRWIFLVAALSTIAAFVLGFLRNEEAGTAGSLQSDLDTASSTIGQLRAGNESLSTDLIEANAEIESLQKRIVDLEARVPEEPVDSGTGGGDPSGSNDAPPLRNTGEVVVRDDYYDLNSPGPGWADAVEKTNYADTISYQDGLFFQSVRTLLLPVDETADYERCRNATGYADEYNLENDVLPADVSLCFRTNSGRYGTIKLVAIDAESATLEITTWEIEQ